MSIQSLVYLLIFINAAMNPPQQGTDVEYFDETNYLFQADVELGCFHKTDLSIIRKTEVLTTEVYLDSRGARVGRASEPPVSGIDLVAVGGSQTFGPGVENHETFASQIATRLGMTVRNFGVSGQGGVESLLLLKRDIDLRPKVVVYGFWEDHFKRNVRICMNRRGPVCAEGPTVQFDGRDKPFIRLPADAVGCFNRVRRWGISRPPGTVHTGRF
jgi:hypothetical protein